MSVVYIETITELKEKLLFIGVKPWLRKEIFRSSVCIKDDVKRKEKREGSW
jgi:hypothetical protein